MAKSSERYNFTSMGIKSFLNNYKIDNYIIKKLYKSNVPLIQSFLERNKEFYQIIDGFISSTEAIDEWDTRDETFTVEQKRWIGLFDKNNNDLVAILEIVPFAPRINDFWLDLILVDKDHRKEGIGSKLLKLCFDLAKYLEITGDIRLLVEEWNTNGLSYWKHKGFVEYDKQPYDFDPSNGKMQIYMKKPIYMSDDYYKWLKNLKLSKNASGQVVVQYIDANDTIRYKGLLVIATYYMSCHSKTHMHNNRFWYRLNDLSVREKNGILYFCLISEKKKELLLTSEDLANLYRDYNNILNIKNKR